MKKHELLNKAKELILANLQPGESKLFDVPVWAGGDRIDGVKRRANLESGCFLVSEAVGQPHEYQDELSLNCGWPKSVFKAAIALFPEPNPAPEKEIVTEARELIESNLKEGDRKLFPEPVFFGSKRFDGVVMYDGKAGWLLTKDAGTQFETSEEKSFNSIWHRPALEAVIGLFQKPAVQSYRATVYDKLSNTDLGSYLNEAEGIANYLDKIGFPDFDLSIVHNTGQYNLKIDKNSSNVNLLVDHRFQSTLPALIMAGTCWLRIEAVKETGRIGKELQTINPNLLRYPITEAEATEAAQPKKSGVTLFQVIVLDADKPVQVIRQSFFLTIEPAKQLYIDLVNDFLNGHFSEYEEAYQFHQNTFSKIHINLWEETVN